MAEGVVGAAICARFIYKNQNVTAARFWCPLWNACTNQLSRQKGKYTEKNIQVTQREQEGK